MRARARPRKLEREIHLAVLSIHMYAHTHTHTRARKHRDAHKGRLLKCFHRLRRDENERDFQDQSAIRAEIIVLLLFLVFLAPFRGRARIVEAIKASRTGGQTEGQKASLPAAIAFARTASRRSPFPFFRKNCY